ncbi:hypothetical protein [Oceanisphaera pacifica]|uniref:Uncharacterized protein n=1 Tax=Oceanisphaera pacifica TaxID=2818389 RepID=A0ABS3NC96_9GAMM|nr:hypothetical protein [Oceanisphaera pacifica]MBO1518097.1 hypothetical protein [Oceanisphaera pacifica]
MNPAVAQLLPTVMQLLEEAGKTDTGKKVIEKGRKIIEVSLPFIKNASEVTVEFLSTDVGKEIFGDVKGIKLSKKLDILERGLSLPSSYDNNQNTSIKQRISDGFDITKGQNEILFLSNSINYFIDSHKFRVGIDRNISHALQYDVIAVSKYLEKRSDIRFPGYLLHQLQSLSSTISELNVFYASVCRDGYVPDFNEDELLAEMSETVGVEGVSNVNIGYYPCGMILDARRRLIQSTSTQSKQSSGGLFSVSNVKKAFDREAEVEISNGVHDALIILKDELIFNEKLEKEIVKKLKVLPDNKLMIESF